MISGERVEEGFIEAWKPEETDNQETERRTWRMKWIKDRDKVETRDKDDAGSLVQRTNLLYQTRGISVMAYLRGEAPSPTPCRSVRTPWVWEHAVGQKTQDKRSSQLEFHFHEGNKEDKDLKTKCYI